MTEQDRRTPADSFVLLNDVLCLPLCGSLLISVGLRDGGESIS